MNAGFLINVVCLFLWVRVNNMTIVVGILRAGGDTKFSMFLDGIHHLDRWRAAGTWVHTSSTSLFILYICLP